MESVRVVSIRTGVYTSQPTFATRDCGRRISGVRGDDGLYRNTPDGWEIEQDDFGGLLVRHTHSDGAAVAYLWTEIDGGLVARCSLCHAQRLVGEPIDPRPSVTGTQVDKARH
jgi:hypothetical protein